VAGFAEGRIGYREWARRNGRLGDIHSLDDRYDHDVDELMAQSQLLIDQRAEDVQSAPFTLMRLQLAGIDSRIGGGGSSEPIG
jgi:hypothetical protein